MIYSLVFVFLFFFRLDERFLLPTCFFFLTFLRSVLLTSSSFFVQRNTCPLSVGGLLSLSACDLLVKGTDLLPKPNTNEQTNKGKVEIQQASGVLGNVFMASLATGFFFATLGSFSSIKHDSPIPWSFL